MKHLDGPLGRDALRIESLTGAPLSAPLLAPFVIASGRLDAVENAAVCVRLAGGACGWGEIPVLAPVTRESRDEALAALERVAA